MEYNVVRDAKTILSNSNYVVKNPKEYKNKWNKLYSFAPLKGLY